MKENIILVGGGGHCLSVIDSIERTEQYNIIGIIDTKEKVGESIADYRVIGTDKDLNNYYRDGVRHAFITLGSIDNAINRKRLYSLCVNEGYIFPVIIDPSAIIGSNVKIKEGSYVGKGTIINSTVSIGINAIINTGSIVEHNCFISDFTHIAPAVKLAGGVNVGDFTHIGIGSTVIQNIQIGNNVLIGSASNVLIDIYDNAKAYGNPAKVVGYR